MLDGVSLVHGCCFFKANVPIRKGLGTKQV